MVSSLGFVCGQITGYVQKNRIRCKNHPDTTCGKTSPTKTRSIKIPQRKPCSIRLPSCHPRPPCGLHAEPVTAAISPYLRRQRHKKCLDYPNAAVQERISAVHGQMSLEVGIRPRFQRIASLNLPGGGRLWCTVDHRLERIRNSHRAADLKIVLHRNSDELLGEAKLYGGHGPDT
jgi:hypothetical protein